MFPDGKYFCKYKHKGQETSPKIVTFEARCWHNYC